MTPGHKPNLLHSQSMSHNIYILLMVGLLFVGVLSAVFVYTKVDQANRTHITARADTVAQVIQAEDIMMLDGTEEDLTNQRYIDIKSTLMNIRSVNDDIRFIYLIGQQEDGKLFFFVDSEEAESEDYSPPGQSYDEASQDMYDLFVDKQSKVEGPTSDRWGTWISAYAPILDGDGNVLALLGMDTPAQEYMTDMVVYAVLPFAFTLILTLIIAFMLHMRNKELVYIAQKEEFLSVASHEIRTPLTGMRWAIENLLQAKPTKVKIDASSKKVLSLVYDSTVNLMFRINNLINITAFESGKKISLRKEPVAMKGLMQEVTDSLMVIAEHRNVSIDASAIPDNLSLFTDVMQIRHVFLNLVSNAVRYTEQNTTVIIGYEQKKGMHVFSIKDFGKGFKKEEQKNLFSAYKKTPAGGGMSQYDTGLGLYLAKKIVTLCGGALEVDTIEGKGTTFFVSLPEERG